MYRRISRRVDADTHLYPPTRFTQAHLSQPHCGSVSMTFVARHSLMSSHTYISIRHDTMCKRQQPIPPPPCCSALQARKRSNTVSVDMHRACAVQRCAHVNRHDSVGGVEHCSPILMTLADLCDTVCPVWYCSQPDGNCVGTLGENRRTEKRGLPQLTSSPVSALALRTQPWPHSHW